MILPKSDLEGTLSMDLYLHSFICSASNPSFDVMAFCLPLPSVVIVQRSVVSDKFVLMSRSSLRVVFVWSVEVDSFNAVRPALVLDVSKHNVNEDVRSIGR